jgi:hypothetical protein
MARTKKPKDSESTQAPVKVDETESFMKQVRKRLDASVVNEKDERKRGQEETKFIFATDQWDAGVRQQRGKGRLCLTINKLPVFLDQIDGDVRLNKPGIKVKAVDSAADPKTADVIEGLIRYIERSSRAAKIYSYAGVHLAAGGRGAWRVKTEYCPGDTFDVDIKIERIANPYSVYYDPTAVNDDKQDGDYFLLISDMSKDTYKEKYGKDPVDYDAEGSELANWHTETSVRVAEYFYRHKVGEKIIYQLEDGRVVDDATLTPEDVVKRKRTVPEYKIKWALIDGKRILDEEDVPGQMFPIVLVWGKQICLDGKVDARGFARYTMDSQKLRNYFWSQEAESAALQPKQPVWIPDFCLAEHKEIWDKSLDINYPYLAWKPNPNFPNLGPQRQPPAQSSGANLNLITLADNDINDTTGIAKAGLGQNDGEKSGKMVNLRKIESDTGQYAFLDNLAEGVVTTGEICVSMIPETHDTARMIRILGKDMKEKIVRINDGNGIDFSVGKYDVDISAEASYSTQREEFIQKMDTILPKIPPEQVAVISDILFQSMDFSKADEIAERIKRTIPPAILGPEQDEDGNDIPQAQSPAPPPDPLLIAELELKKIEIMQANVKLEGMKLDNDLKVQTRKEEIATIIAEMMGQKKEGGKDARE